MRLRRFLKVCQKYSPFSGSSLSTRILGMVGAVLVVTGCLFCLSSCLLVKRQFDASDAQQYRQDVERVVAVLRRDRDLAGSFVVDYAIWDEAYDFVRNRNPNFVKEHFNFDSLLGMEFHGMGIVTQTGQDLVNLEWQGNQVMAPLPTAVVTWVQREVQTREQPFIWMGWLAGRPMLLALAPITDTEGVRRSGAWLYMVRYLDGDYQKLIQNLTGVGFGYESSTGGNGEVSVVQRQGKWVVEQAIAPGLALGWGGGTRLGAQRQMTYLLLVGNAVALGAVALAGTYGILRRYILGRLQFFSQQAKVAQVMQDDGIRWPVRGQDELDTLAVALNELQTTLAQRQRELHQIAHYDSLTGLPNRRCLLEGLALMLQEPGTVGVLMLLDLNEFKKINDTHGHLAGDRLLMEVGQRLVQAVPSPGWVARLGGDEFVVVLPQAGEDRETARGRAARVAQAILAGLGRPYACGEQGMTVSIGITLWDGQSRDVYGLLQEADLAMYQSKRLGRNQFALFQPQLQQRAQQRADWERDLLLAIEMGQLELYYQPQVTYDHQLLGVEALVRWQHPERGWVSPGEFIPLAEETGLILPLGAWVLTTACTQWVELTAELGLTDVPVAVNISAQQVHQSQFVPEVLDILERTGLAPPHLTLELTESLMLADTEGVITKLNRLRQAGVTFALDDFGLGYSALTYLKRLPLSQIKIDRSFVQQVHRHTHDQAIARMVIALGETLNLDVVAEGVEQEAQRTTLAAYGCRAYQGYWFAPPLPLAELRAWIARHTSGQVLVGNRLCHDRKNSTTHTRAVTAGHYHLQGQRPGE